MRERFLREARAAFVLRHPNVAAVYRFGASPDDSHCYYAMELVEGETLEARVRREGPLNARPEVLEIAMLNYAGIDGCRSPRFDRLLDSSPATSC